MKPILSHRKEARKDEGAVAAPNRLLTENAARAAAVLEATRKLMQDRSDIYPTAQRVVRKVPYYG